MLICLPQLKKTYLLLPKGAGTIWYWENELNGKNLWYPSISKLNKNNLEIESCYKSVKYSNTKRLFSICIITIKKE